MKIAWKKINEIFEGTFKEDLEDRHVYVNIHKLGLYRVTCRYPTFPCVEMIHLFVSHTNLEMMKLSNG